MDSQFAQLAQAAEPTLTALQTAIDSASALLVNYSFSFVGALIVLVLGVLLARVLERWARVVASRIRGVDATLVGFLALALRYGVLVFVFVAVLAQFGVQTTSIIAVLGAAGLAIGLALQGTLQNIAAGIMLLVLRPFRVDEYIVAGDVSGTIRQIGLFTTDMESADGVYLSVPNGALWNTPITNYSRNATRRFELAIGIGYDDNIGLARQALLELARADPRVLADPEPMTYVKSLDASAVTIVLRVWAATPDWFDLTGALTQAAKERFGEIGVSIPYPQQVVTYQGPKPGP
jgi:small conductance mechanosensitive channel